MSFGITVKRLMKYINRYGVPSEPTVVKPKCIVTFTGNAEEIIVYDADHTEKIITPDAEGKYHLVEGSYDYDATADGHVAERGVSLNISAEDVATGTKTVNVTLDPETYDLHVTENRCTITVTRGEEVITAGTDVLTYGDVIVITAEPEASYSMISLSVNGHDFVSGSSLTVDRDTIIVGVAN